MVRALQQGAGLAVGVDHPEYAATVASVAPAMRASLAADLSA
jgi:hypothetical protein